jgi:uncharacterized Zn finger protein
MSEGTTVYLFCETCEDETPHRILKGRIGPGIDEGFDGTVQCQQCSLTHSAHIEVEKPMEIPSIISNGSNSEKTRIEFYPKEVVMVNDEILWEDHNLMITSIEIGDKRVKRAEASNISSLWLKVFDSIDINVSIVEGPNTKSERINAAPEEEFEVGDLLEFGNTKVVITKIKSVARMIYREGKPVEARDIKRIYTKRVDEKRY